MTGISTLHAASLLRRHDMKLDSHGEMGTLGNLKFAAVGGTAVPARGLPRQDPDTPGRAEGCAVQHVATARGYAGERRAARPEALRPLVRQVDGVHGRRRQRRQRGQDVASHDGQDAGWRRRWKWRGPLQDALAKVNEKDLEAMREGMQDLELAYPVSVGLPPDNVHALFVLLRACSPRPERRCAGAVLSPRRLPSHRRPGRRPRTRLNPLPGHVHAPIGAAVGRVATAEGAGPNPPQGLIPPPPPRLRRPPRNRRRRRPPRDRTRRPTNAAITMRWPMRSAIRSRKAAPSPGEAGAKPSHQDALLDAIRNPQLRSRRTRSSRRSSKDKAKVDAARTRRSRRSRKARRPAWGLMDEIKGTEGLSPSQLKGRAKKRVVDSPETPMSKASSGS